MSEWKEVKLGDVCELLDCLHKTPVYSEKGYPMVRVTDIKNGALDTSNCLRVNSDIYADFSKGYKPKIGDIVFSRVGSFGNSSIVTKETDFCIGQNTILLIPHEVDPFFAFYYLISPDARNQIDGLGGGSTQPTISMKSIREIILPYPPLPEQTAIASILSSLDDKIDLLHRQNATLEKMAETLFRQWFVEEAKEDWEEISLYEAIELAGGGTPKTTVNEYWNGNIKWLSGGDIAANHKNFVVCSEKSITESGLKNSSAKLLPKFSTVISARGTVGKYCMLSEPMAYSQSNYGILPKYKNCFFFTYLLVAHSVDELQSAAYGSVFDTITTNTFKGLNISLPKTNQILEFEEVVKPYFMKILTNQTQIRTLTTLRDTLLPKLMSSDVTVEI